MARIRSNDEREIPLWVIPHVIAKHLRKTGDKIYRISVKRTHWHHYNISIRTKPMPRELAPVPGTVFVPVPLPFPENPGSVAGSATGRCA